jgi:hypothetical protein
MEGGLAEKLLRGRGLWGWLAFWMTPFFRFRLREESLALDPEAACFIIIGWLPSS